MANRKNEFNLERVMGYIKTPNIEIYCPNEYVHYKESKILYMLYKVNDETYPDIVKITKSKNFYDRPILEIYTGSDTANSIERFRDFNTGKEEIIAKLIEELSSYDMNYDKIDEIFNRYKDRVGPICALFKLCNYFPILCIGLDIRIYKGKPTVIRRSLVVRDIVAFVRRQLDKDQLYKRWPEILERVGIGTTITDVIYVPVDGHPRELKSEKFTYMQGKTILVRAHGKLIVKKDEE